MKKVIMIIVSTVLFGTVVKSQDLIIKPNGDEIKVKVLEVTQTEVKYKNFDNINGPTYSILKSELFMIKYENGTKDVFNEVKPITNETKTVSNETKSSNDICLQGKIDANKNYKAFNSGAYWSMAATYILSPVIGLIPTIACSGTEPADKNLRYPDAQLIKNNNYTQCYKEQSYKIKKKTLWLTYGISTIGWGICAALLFL